MDLEGHARLLIGDLVLKLATAAAEIDALREKVAALEAAARKDEDDIGRPPKVPVVRVASKERHQEPPQ